MLKENGTEVTSTTLPPKNAPNVKMAGAHKERTLVINAETQETLTQRIVFDERGFPDFRPYMKYETTISGDLGSMPPDAHKRAATRRLREDIKAGKVDGALFDEKQSAQIKHGLEKIKGYTWHHHQDSGRMQLVPEDVHEWARHVGGDALWGAKK